MKQPSSLSSRSLSQGDSRARGSLQTQSECKFMFVCVYLELIYVGHCVCVRATLALRYVGFIFFKNSYLPGCVCISRLAALRVSVSSNAGKTMGWL